MTTPKKKRVSVAGVLAGTFGWDVGEMSEYRYQYGRTGKLAIYAIDNEYWTASATKPTWSGLDWKKHTDQHFAETSSLTIWRANMEEAE